MAPLKKQCFTLHRHSCCTYGQLLHTHMHHYNTCRVDSSKSCRLGFVHAEPHLAPPKAPELWSIAAQHCGSAGRGQLDAAAPGKPLGGLN